MKKYIFVSFLFLTFISCNDSNSGNSDATNVDSNAAAVNSHVLIFFDKTQSVDVTKEFVYTKYQAAIKEIIAQNIKTKGDILEIFFIHENTSKAKCLTAITRTEKESTEGLNATDLEAASTNYDMSIQKERNQIYQMAIQKMMEKNTGLSNLETNISASVPVLADAVSSKKSVKVYYFSDMVESLKNGRDFHKMAPISHDQATEWAKTDAAANKNHNLANAEISIILPFAPTSSSKENNPNVGDYWKTYFEALGAMSVKEI